MLPNNYSVLFQWYLYQYRIYMDSEEQEDLLQAMLPEGYLFIKSYHVCVCVTKIYTLYQYILISYFKGVGDKIKELQIFLGFPPSPMTKWGQKNWQNDINQSCQICMRWRENWSKLFSDFLPPPRFTKKEVNIFKINVLPNCPG